MLWLYCSFEIRFFIPPSDGYANTEKRPIAKLPHKQNKKSVGFSSSFQGLPVIYAIVATLTVITTSFVGPVLAQIVI